MDLSVKNSIIRKEYMDSLLQYINKIFTPEIKQIWILALRYNKRIVYHNQDHPNGYVILEPRAAGEFIIYTQQHVICPKDIPDIIERGGDFEKNFLSDIEPRIISASMFCPYCSQPEGRVTCRSGQLENCTYTFGIWGNFRYIPYVFTKSGAKEVSIGASLAGTAEEQFLMMLGLYDLLFSIYNNLYEFELI